MVTIKERCALSRPKNVLPTPLLPCLERKTRLQKLVYLSVLDYDSPFPPLES
jgi:hypothetical protein